MKMAKKDKVKSGYPKERVPEEKKPEGFIVQKISVVTERWAEDGTWHNVVAHSPQYKPCSGDDSLFSCRDKKLAIQIKQRLETTLLESLEMVSLPADLDKPYVKLNRG
jgi:hypothetical protein